MGVIIPRVVTEASASGAQVIDGSLRMAEGDGTYTPYLKRTNSLSGNRRTWTFSGWVKRARVDNSQTSTIINYANTSTSSSGIEFGSPANSGYDNKLRFNSFSSGNNMDLWSTQLLRDTSAWYHIMQVYDSSQSTDSNRVKMYINGEHITNYSAASYPSNRWPSQHAEGPFCYAGSPGGFIGSYHWSGSDASWKGNFYASQFYLIDGQAVGPENFGFTDPLTGVWRPKKFNGTGFNNFNRQWSTLGTYTNWDTNNYKSAYMFNGAGRGYVGQTSLSATEASTAADSNAATWELGNDTPLKQISSLRILMFINNNWGDTNQIKINDVDVTSTMKSAISYQTVGWVDFGSTFSELKKIYLKDYYRYILAIEVNGNTLLDNGVGITGFYLPFDGSAPIGQDQSGSGNNWTPMCLGNSVSLDNPIVSGATPILNTVDGGRVAVPGSRGGVRGSVGVAVTVYNSGSGNKYYLDGEEAKTLSYNRGQTVTFDTSDSTVSGHPFRFATAADAAGSTQYTTGSVTGASEGSAGAATTITIPTTAPENLYYYCTNHSGMGGSIAGIATDWRVADPYASYCKLAIPHAGGAKDYTSLVNTGTTSSMTSFSANNSTHPTCATLGCGSYYSSALFCNGTNDYPRVNFNAGSFNFLHNQADSGTVEMWMFQYGYSTEAYVFCDSAGSNEIGMMLVMAGDNQVCCYLAKGTSGSTYNSGNASVPRNRWHHIAITKEKVGSNVELKIYIDGVLGNSNTSITASDLSNSNSTRDFFQTGSAIGHEGSRGFSNFYMSDLRIYNTVKYRGDFVPGAISPNILPDSPSGVAYSSQLTKVTEGSVGFNDSASSFLQLDTDNAYEFGTGDFSIECWFMIDQLGEQQHLYEGRKSGNADRVLLYVRTDDKVHFYGNAANRISSEVLHKDVWYHVAACRVSGTTTLYLNGVSQGTYSDSNDYIKPASYLYIGIDDSPAGSNVGGFISNMRVLKGSAAYSSDFTPSTKPLTNITNTVLLCCQSPTDPTAAAVIPTGSITANGTCGAPVSFNPFNTDINTVRGKETRYGTWTPLMKNSNVTLTEGNLVAKCTQNAWRSAFVDIGTKGGKWYFEMTTEWIGNKAWIAICPSSEFVTCVNTHPSNSPNSYGGRVHDGVYRNNSTNITGQTGPTFPIEIGGVAMCAYDLDNGKFWAGINGKWFRKSGGDLPDPAKGRGAGYTGINTSLTYHAAAGIDQFQWKLNCGQTPFKYSPPEGFNAICDANLPSPGETRPSRHVKPQAYTGNGGTNVIDCGFKPDLVACKSTSNAWDWGVFDTVRSKAGNVYNYLKFNSTDQQATGGTTALQSYNDNGFTMGADAAFNTNSATFCSYNWKAGGNKNTFNVDGRGYATFAASGTTAGSITPTGTSIGTKQGFSIIQYTGTGSLGTVPHGLNSAPDFLVIKRVNANEGWQVYHSQMDATAPEDYSMELESTGARADTTNRWNDTAPTNSVFTVNTHNGVNASGSTYIAYLWHDIPGVQKFGTYTGNADSSLGPYVELGFRPALLICRNTGGTSDWPVMDDVTNSYNPMDAPLFTCYNNAQTADGGYKLDFLSNGFKVRNNQNSYNQNGYRYIYMAWAHQPEHNLYGGQSNAR